MGVAILTQLVVNACRRKLSQGDAVLAAKGLLERRSTSFIKVSGRVRNDTFKTRLTFSFTVVISA